MFLQYLHYLVKKGKRYFYALIIGNNNIVHNTSFHLFAVHFCISLRKFIKQLESSRKLYYIIILYLSIKLKSI